MPFRAPKWETVSYSGRRTPVRAALLALDGAAVAAVLLRAVRRPDRGSGVCRRILEHRAAEVLRGRHPPLAHEVDQRRRPVLGDPELSEDHGGGPEQAHHVGAGPVEPLPVGHRHGSIAVHGDGLEVLPPQDGAQAPPPHRVPLAHHDAGEEDPVLPGGADRGDAPPVRQGARRLPARPSPQRSSAGSSSCPAEVTASTAGRGLLPSTTIARSPAARRRHANRPPAEQSYTVPVSGERETTSMRADVGAGVPHRGPTAKTTGIAGSNGERVWRPRSRRTPRPRPPRYARRSSGGISSRRIRPEERSTTSICSRRDIRFIVPRAGPSTGRTAEGGGGPGWRRGR